MLFFPAIGTHRVAPQVCARPSLKPCSKPVRIGPVKCTQVPSTSLNEVVLMVADIGGTNARLTVSKTNLTTGESISEYAKVYPTSGYPTFNTALRTFLCEDDVKSLGSISAACLAVAGPVADNACAMTNLNWVIDGDDIERDFGFKTQVLNDFEAVGYGIPVLGPSDIVALNDVPRKKQGPIAVLGPGTGLGEAQLMWDSGQESYKVWPSEGSHAEFAPRGELQRELMIFAEKENDLPCEIEHLACGSGLARIYRFICHQAGVPHEDLDPSEISKKALTTGCTMCSNAVDVFLQIIGGEAGHMGLRSMATGGIYIAGGITPKLISRIQEGGVQAAFLNSRSRFSPTIQTFPLYCILDDNVGLRGTREYALSLARKVAK